jgi:phosphoglycolate phosphatase
MMSGTGRPAPAYGHLYWDLDGTLTDPRQGMVRCLEYALGQLGRAVDHERIERFIGPPLARTLSEQYGLEGEELARAVALYRERYQRLGWRENAPVPGIEALLSDLAAGGTVMAVATVKPWPMAERILTTFGLRGFFRAVHGPSPQAQFADKADILGQALGARPWAGPGRAAMIGDHEEDMRAARQWRLDGIAVLYGYGDRDAMLAELPVASAASVAELRTLLLG